MNDQIDIDAKQLEWEAGTHTTSKGDVVNLSEMNTPQLKNTINKYAQMGYNTTALQKELDSRPVQEK